MATVAAQVTDGIRRIVTKLVDGERKVSCSCCVTQECCMYSSEMYRQGYLSFEDLPDEIVFVNTSNQEFPISKAASPESYFIVGVGMTLFYGVEGDGVVLRDDGGGWGYWSDNSPPTDNLYECLISYFDEESQTSPTWVYKDNFADTYTITTSFSSGTVTRQGLCLWNGVDGNGCPLQLIYGGFGGDPETEPAESGSKWSVSFSKFESPVEGEPEACIESFGRLKSGSQNSPIGTYDISYASEGPESATVSE